MSERATLAEQLRQKSIGILRDHGLSRRADRLARYGYDGYPDEEDFQFIGQLASMHMPHSSREQLYPDSDTDTDFPYVRCLLGFLNYLLQLTLNGDGTIRIGTSQHYATHASFPLRLPIRPG